MSWALRKYGAEGVFTSAIFGDDNSEYPEPALIDEGQVNPTGEAAGSDRDKNQAGWVPNGWWDKEQGVDDTYYYEYASHRDYIQEDGDGHWGDFSEPCIWHQYKETTITYDLVPNVSVIHADADGTVNTDGIIVKAYRTVGDKKSGNILPEYQPPEDEDYYYAEYRIDNGGQWQACAGFNYYTGPDDDIEVLQVYGISPIAVRMATKNITLRLLLSSNSNVVLKEIAPIDVVKVISEQEVIDVVDGGYITKAFFNTLFEAIDSNGQPITPNGRNNDGTQKTPAEIHAKVGLWSSGFISALGKNDAGGGGGGGGAVTLEDLTDVEISSPAVGQVLKLRQNPTTGLYEWYNGSDEGVTSIDWSNITNKPSTFTPSAHNHDERYYINNGTIYLGGLSITPVTSLEGYAMESYVNNNFLSTIGGSLNGDLTLNNASLIQQYMINPSDPEYAYLTIEDGIITLDSGGKIQTRDESYYFDNNGNAVFATLKVGVNDVWHAGNHPTTLGGYGITDAKIENGVITLGSNTIMPVTSVAMTMPTGLSVTGSPITKTGTFAVSYASGYEGFTTAWKNDIYDKVYAIFSWFEVDANGDIKTKDKPNNGGHRGFYSESFVSALGKNDASGSGGLDIDAMWSELMNIDNTKVIDISHIPTIPTSKINNLIGYVTDCLTDYASIAGNTIYIGEDSLNLNNYLPLIGGGMDGNIYWQYSGRRTTRLEIGQHTLSTTAESLR